MLSQLRLNCNKRALLFFLVCLIPGDNTWEPELSLALDRALVAWEGAW